MDDDGGRRRSDWSLGGAAGRSDRSKSTWDGAAVGLGQRRLPGRCQRPAPSASASEGQPPRVTCHAASVQIGRHLDTQYNRGLSTRHWRLAQEQMLTSASFELLQCVHLHQIGGDHAFHNKLPGPLSDDIIGVLHTLPAAAASASGVRPPNDTALPPAPPHVISTGTARRCRSPSRSGSRATPRLQL